MNQKGFTLIELMIVIAIIAILLAAVVPQLLRVSILNEADKNIANNVPIGSVENKSVRERMIVILEEKKKEDQKIREAEKLQKPEAPQTVDHPAPQVTVQTSVPQDIVLPLNIECDSLLSNKCNLTVKLKDKTYLLPLFCKEGDDKTTTCRMQ